MIHKKPRAELLGQPFKGKKAGPERSKSTINIELISHNAPELRIAALRELAEICIASISEPDDTASSLLRLFEHHAKFSPYEDVREGCIDALAECCDTFRLKSLNFEIGSESTRRYRDKVLQRLEAEIS